MSTKRSRVVQVPRLTCALILQKAYFREEVSVLEQSCFSASIERVLVYTEACKYKKRNIMAATKTSCSSARLDAKGILQILHLRYRYFNKRFCKKVLRANDIFLSKVQ